MLVRIWRFPTLLLTALLAGITFCHVLEMPAKLHYPASLYLTIHRTLYVAFGPPNAGVFVELGAILTSGVLVVLVRRRAGFWPTLIGAACLLMGLVAYFALVEPANSALRMMSIETPPENWEQWRDQWEYGHAIHFALDCLGLCALLWSVLLPAREARERPAPPVRAYRAERSRSL